MTVKHYDIDGPGFDVLDQCFPSVFAVLFSNNCSVISNVSSMLELLTVLAGLRRSNIGLPVVYGIGRFVYRICLFLMS